MRVHGDGALTAGIAQQVELVAPVVIVDENGTTADATRVTCRETPGISRRGLRGMHAVSRGTARWPAGALRTVVQAT